MEVTLFVIFFTVFLQGGSVKLFVKLFGLEEAKQRRQSGIAVVTEEMIGHTMAGMETSLGGGTLAHSWVERLEHFEKLYLEPVLCRKSSPQKYLNQLVAQEKKKSAVDEVEVV